MSKTAILYCEADAKVLSTQTKLFNQAGYAVVPIEGRPAMEAAVKAGGFDIAILGHTLTRDDRHHLPYMVKRGNPAASVIDSFNRPSRRIVNKASSSVGRP